MATTDAPGRGDFDIEEARRRARKGPQRLVLGRIVLLTVTFVSTVTVARLVGPREYGLATMSVVILTFAQTFRDFGVTNAVLRKGHVTKAELTLIFWFNVAATTLISAILAALAPLIADYYDEPIVFWTVLVSLIGFQLGGLALQHRALINRDLRFGTIALIDVSGLLVGFGVTLVLAVIRHDVWAIVIGNVAQATTSAALAIALSGWRPNRPARSSELWGLLKFGANSTVHAVSVLISNNIAVVLIGHQFGAALLGQYSRAQNLFALPNSNLVQPITQATMPLMTRLRSDPPEYRKAYLGLVRRLCVFLMPLSVTFAFAALPLTRLLLGDRWHTAGLVLTVLAPALAFMGIAYAAADLFITQDRSAELRNLGLFELVVRVGAIGLGATMGLIETAAAFTLSTMLVSVVRTVVSGRRGPVTSGVQLRSASAGLLPALGAAVLIAPVFFFLDSGSDLVTTLVRVAAGVLGAFLGALTRKPSREAMAELAESFGLSRLTRRRKAAATA